MSDEGNDPTVRFTEMPDVGNEEIFRLLLLDVLELQIGKFLNE